MRETHFATPEGGTMSRNTLRPRRSLCAGLITVMALLSAGQAYADGEGKDTAVWNDQGESRISRGFAIAPVPLKLKGKNRALVGLGSYIVNAQGGCADCHSCPTYASGHNPFRGQPKQFNGATYLAGGVPFGPFTSRNITPDEETANLELTLALFTEVLRN